MRKLKVIAHLSLDGFVAGANGEFDNFVDGNETLNFVCGITDSADAAIFGRHSFELLDTHWPTAGEKADAITDVKRYSAWYNRVKKFVLTSRPLETSSSNVKTITNNIFDTVTGLKNEEGKDILIFGSPSAVDYLLPLGLIDEFWILLHPVVFRTGIPLFKPTGSVSKMKLIKNTPLAAGIMGLNYEVIQF